MPEGGAITLSELEVGQTPGEARCLIIDCFGKLASLYRYADTALIGGGFGAGIHNINEAAVYGLPVVFGPRHEKFKEATDLIQCGGGFCYTDRTTLDSILDRLSTDTDCRAKAGQAVSDYVRSQLGATDRIWNAAIAPLLSSDTDSDPKSDTPDSKPIKITSDSQFIASKFYHLEKIAYFAPQNRIH